MKKIFLISLLTVMLNFIYAVSAYSSEEPKYFFCKANWGNDIYLKFQITNKIKYDVVEGKFISNGKDPEPTLEKHDDKTFENKNYNRFLSIFTSEKYYYFSRFEPGSWFGNDVGDTVDIIINRFDLSTLLIVHQEEALHPGRSIYFDDNFINQEFENKKFDIKQCTEIEHKQKI
ncbi:MAG: hypothetical protein L7S72_07900 [Flavobacteriales bacterium]|nr:hypothetical protein [Flavobacteriales bacterium]